MKAISTALFIVGCSTPPDSTSQATRDYDAISYTLRAHFDWSANRLVASEDIVIAAAGAVDGSGAIQLDTEVDITRVHAEGRDLVWAADDDGHVTVELDGATAFTVDFTAEPQGALHASRSRDDDPVTSRVVFTDSEPLEGVAWLVAKQDPSDRAKFAVALSVADDEDALANGTRLPDAAAFTTGRTIRYAIDQPIPPYVMAFAMGQLDHVDRPGRVPLSLWYRRGLTVDAEANLDAMASAMATFEGLVGPYPWETYSVALLPIRDDAEENVTVTFSDELTGQGTIDFELHAHELSHHWFGDWMTIASFDDLWVKEGMATIMEFEATKPYRDRAGAGRLMASYFEFDPEDAINDYALDPEDKFTTGPYERAATVIAQIRAIVGEQVFWPRLRQILADHALGAIDSAQFVHAFEPELPAAVATQVLGSLTSHELPRLAVAVSGRTVTLTLGDLSGQVIAPIELTVVDAAGAATTTKLAPGGTAMLAIPPGGYFAPDEREVHPPWTDFGVGEDAFDTALGPLLVPTAAPALAAFTSRSAAHQELALDAAASPGAPADFGPLHAALDSDTARVHAVVGACDEANTTAAWGTAAKPFLHAPARQEHDTDYATCPSELVVAELRPELEALAGDRTPKRLARVEYLISFDYGAAESLRLIGKLATTAPTLHLREVALERLVEQTDSDTDYEAPTTAQRAAWRAFFEARLVDGMSNQRFEIVWQGLENLDDIAALPAVGSHLSGLDEELQLETVCDVVAMTATRPGSWDAFKAAATGLAEDAAAALADPGTCADDSARRVHRRAKHARRR